MRRIGSETGSIIAESIIKGMLLEVACTPKPGLVDRNNNGANSDMDFPLFCLSSASICQDFHKFADLGLESSLSDRDFLSCLRREGIRTEKRMFRATGGVNTQKGLIFLMGLIGASAGRVLRQGKTLSAHEISGEVMSLTAGICSRELEVLRNGHGSRVLTKGEEIYLRFGVRGIRGEVEDGLPTVMGYGLPELRESLSRGADINDSMVNCLLKIISVSEDTNVITRSSYEFLKTEVQPMALDALEKGGMFTSQGRNSVCAMDDFFVSRNINPGGSADLLAATVALHLLESTGIGS